MILKCNIIYLTLSRAKQSPLQLITVSNMIYVERIYEWGFYMCENTDDTDESLKKQFELLGMKFEAINTSIERVMGHETKSLDRVVIIIAVVTTLLAGFSYLAYTGALDENKKRLTAQQDHIETVLEDEVSRVDTALSKLEGKSFPDEGSIEVLSKGGYIGDGGIALIEFSLDRNKEMNNKFANITARISFKINVKGSAGTSVGIITTLPQSVIDEFTIFEENINAMFKIRLEKGITTPFKSTIVEGYGYSGFFTIRSQTISCDIAETRVAKLVVPDDLGIMSMEPILEEVAITLKGEFKTKGIKGLITDCDTLNNLLDSPE